MTNEKEKVIPRSPFDSLIIKIQSELWTQHRNFSKKELDKKSFLVQQLGLLRAIYVSSLEVNHFDQVISQPKGERSVSFEETALEQPRPSKKVFLDYYNFINVLCQFGRVLPKHFPKTYPIPLLERIRFYRNKVVEHWDDYTNNISLGAFSYRIGKTPIPHVEMVYSPEERKALLGEMKGLFNLLGSDLQLDDDKIYNLIGIDPEYNEAVFTALEKIEGGLRKRAGDNKDLDNLIEKLIQFSFPVPILDTEEYGKKIIEYLESVTQ